MEKIEYLCCTSCGLKFFSPSVTGDEHFYYNVLQNPDLYYMDDNKAEYNFASRFITLNDNVLDIGCGKGAFSKNIRFNTYTGLELSTNAKKLANDNGIQIFNQKIQEHSISNQEKYNVVCTFQVLEHVDTSEIYTFLKSAFDWRELATEGLIKGKYILIKKIFRLSLQSVEIKFKRSYRRSAGVS